METRCPGSDRAAARVRFDRAQCAYCGRRFSRKLNGMVRRHSITSLEIARPELLTYPTMTG